MKLKKLTIKFLFIALLLMGGLQSGAVFAEKKAVEGQNEANVEFYKPTPKPEPKKPDPKSPNFKGTAEVIKGKLPQTNEKNNSYYLFVGSLLLIFFAFCLRRKVGVVNEK